MIRAIGLMSGTSLDGVDVALVETDGTELGRVGPSAYRPYEEHERALLRRALGSAASLSDRTSRPGILADAETLVTAAHAEAVERFLQAHRMAPAEIDVVGFHGQTVLHRPESRLTVQIGDGQGLARRLGIKVVHDFRAADVAAGGQGAPLVPIYHQALATRLDRRPPVVVVNIGGVANLTYIDGDGGLIAFDTGPGNALLDDFMQARTGTACDRDGAAAARGTVDQARLARFCGHSFFAAAPPKSLDRNAFAQVDLTGLATADGAATLTAFTVATIAAAAGRLPRVASTFIIAGGGARNPTLMRGLAARLSPAEVLAADAVGWSGDAIEAQAFGYLAARHVRGLPITFPGTTGVSHPMLGGILAKP